MWNTKWLAFHLPVSITQGRAWQPRYTHCGPTFEDLPAVANASDVLQHLEGVTCLQHTTFATPSFCDLSNSKTDPQNND
jgi:hypothetical protein